MTTFITTHVFIFKCDSFHVLYYFVFIAAKYVLVLTILCLGTVFLKICVVCVYKDKNQSISANLQGYATDMSGQLYLNIY